MSGSSNQLAVKSLKSLCISMLRRSSAFHQVGRIGRVECRPSEARRGGRQDGQDRGTDE